MNSFLRSLAHHYIDRALRVRNKVRRLVTGARVFSTKKDLSDSQASFYIESLSKITTASELGNFRRNFDYREILEHVDYQTGKLYLERIEELGFSINELINIGLPNDFCGKPRMYRYGNLPEISPTTLRYLSVACELEKNFGALDGMNILEIGAGYGGQLSIISRLFKIKSYSIYDLPEAQELIARYTRDIGTSIVPDMFDINNIKSHPIDLVISNYAFSELPREVQREYAQKILCKAPRGYMIMNSGRKNETTRSNGKLSYGELQELVPGVSIVEETPLTSVDNYVVLWGQSLETR